MTVTSIKITTFNFVAERASFILIENDFIKFEIRVRRRFFSVNIFSKRGCDGEEHGPSDAMSCEGVRRLVN